MKLQAYATTALVRFYVLITGARVLAARFSVVLLAACQLAQSAAAEESVRIPGNYVVWRSKDSEVCDAARTLVNALPKQDLADASNTGAPGFLRWSGEPSYARSRSPGAPRSFFPVTYTSVRLGRAETASLVLRYSGMIAGATTDSLYVLPPGVALPKDGDDLAKLLKSRPPDYSSYADNSILRLRRSHGEDWRNWELAGQVTVAAIEMRNRSYFAAQTVATLSGRPSSTLVFSLSVEGAQDDICLLRRICPCDDAECISAYLPPDRAKFIPSANRCRK